MYQFSDEPLVDPRLKENAMRRLAAFLLLALLMCELRLPAQNISGTLAGSVKDPSGAAVAGAEVVARNPATNQESRTSTNDLGYYEIPYLRPGAYQVQASYQGFKSSIREDVELTVDSRLRIDFNLEVGDSKTTISVSGEAPLVEPASSALAQLVTT